MYVHVHPVCFRTEEEVEPAGARVTVSCEHSCECWELNADPVQEHPALLTTGWSLRPLLAAFYSRAADWTGQVGNFGSV